MLPAFDGMKVQYVAFILAKQVSFTNQYSLMRFRGSVIYPGTKLPRAISQLFSSHLTFTILGLVASHTDLNHIISPA